MSWYEKGVQRDVEEQYATIKDQCV